MKQKTKLEILQETFDTYQKTGDRCFNDEGCVYTDSNNPKKHCAAGRCMNDDFLQKLFILNQNKNTSINTILSNYKEEKIFKPEYIGHDILFWKDVQLFHDDYDNFQYHGLSEKGINKKKELIEKYS